ncbi:hypothetical protein CLHUN_13180 [Ruminiclostridium hungatei]|uniref:Uncharacterized protein n=1 Tax=Ruminiclostridium hungatei TaxID=48256 RepID=A0A1V4SLS4_RUMHU|nr:hypothetical protein [Ruminiclostridium hungatei]OPX44764.1 hypothetical protein CLHUN_13180 [Ruminiclostridium hungatei]
MGIIYILLILAALFASLLFAVDAKVRLEFDTDHNHMQLSICWLYPMFKATGTLEAASPVFNLYFFRLHLLKKSIKPGKNSGKTGIKLSDLTGIIRPKDLRIDTRYGFSNPSATGITCGALNAASQFINIDFFNNLPDFMSARDYIYFDAKASVNLGASLTNLLKYYKHRRNFQWIRTQT